MKVEFEQPFNAPKGGTVRAHSTSTVSCGTVTVVADDPPDNGDDDPPDNGDDPEPPDNGNGNGDDPEPPEDTILDRLPGGAAGAVVGGVGAGLLLSRLSENE